MKDQLSAFIDNQLSAKQREQFIDQLLVDPDLQQSWADTHTVAEVMRHGGQQNPLENGPENPQAPILASSGFADRVAIAVQAEATVFAPNALAADVSEQVLDAKAGAELMNEGHGGKVVSLRVKSSERRSAAPLYALAASLALVAVLLVAPGFNQNGGQAAGQPTVASNTAAVGGMVAGNEASASSANEIEALMVEHGEFTGIAALNGLLAYAKVVNNELGTAQQ